ncbi:YheC/YheD family protein [Paenibacillus sp. NPDC058071]|uniref:YheC/YheD family protein n=1 Tax=Paenibacillus sp. NPDC058071 TaxID=3346326 RepID=UPI0036DB4D29
MGASYNSSALKSKWTKTQWLLKSDSLRGYVPNTATFSRSSLENMLSNYATVYFKPTGGSGGFHIVRVKKLASGYQTQLKTTKIRHATLDALYSYLVKRTKERSYLLQKGINLAKTNGNPFDIRVMVQKTNAGVWKTTGMFSKIGKPGVVATNYNQGGKVGFVKTTLAGAGFSEGTIKQKEDELIKLGESVGRLFETHLKGARELGLDVALDSSGRAWILEVNTKPQFYPLKHMGDGSMYRKILSYAKQYGRYK